MPTLTIHCRFFARYAELVGQERLELPMPAGATVADLVVRIRETVPAAGRLPAQPLAAVNQAHAHPGHRLADGDEVAFLPPLAGG